MPGAVVPVAEDALVRPAIANHVVEAELLELGQRLPLRRGHMRLADVGLRIEDVLVGWRDVHVAAHDDVVRAGGDHLPERSQPGELVLVVVRARLAPVRDVHGDNPNPATGGGHRARLRIRKARRTLDAR